MEKARAFKNLNYYLILLQPLPYRNQYQKFIWQIYQKKKKPLGNLEEKGKNDGKHIRGHIAARQQAGYFSSDVLRNKE